MDEGAIIDEFGFVCSEFSDREISFDCENLIGHYHDPTFDAFSGYDYTKDTYASLCQKILEGN